MGLPLPEILTLEASGARLDVAPALGGAILRYATRGFDWLRPTSAQAIERGHPEGFSCFPLAPYSNRIRDGVFRFEGRTIALASPSPHALHGHGWTARWSVVGRSKDRLTIAYRHAPDTWPFAYLASQSFALEDGALRVLIGIENVGQDAMPCGMGLHPYFARTPLCRLTASVASMWEKDSRTLPTRLVPLPKSIGLGNGIEPRRLVLDTVFAGWSSVATIEWPEWDRRLIIRAGPLLKHLVVYSPPDADYFCVEPVSNCTDAFNLAAQGRTDTGLIVLGPGETTETEVSFHPDVH